MVNKDWIGSSQNVYKTIGASNHTDNTREENDFYATEPKAVELLLKLENFERIIWECACGKGHISETLLKNDKLVFSSDLINRGYGDAFFDFLTFDKSNLNYDIITNPPYKYANQFIEKANNILSKGCKIAFLMPIRYLEGKARRKIYDKYPPKTIYVSSGRINCALNGNFNTKLAAAQSYAWFVWEVGYKGETIVKWFN